MLHVFCPFLGEIPCEYCCYITASRFNIESIWMVLMLLLAITKITSCSIIIDVFIRKQMTQTKDLCYVNYDMLTDFTPSRFSRHFTYYV